MLIIVCITRSGLSVMYLVNVEGISTTDVIVASSMTKQTI